MRSPGAWLVLAVLELPAACSAGAAPSADGAADRATDGDTDHPPAAAAAEVGDAPDAPSEPAESVADTAFDAGAAEETDSGDVCTPIGQPAPRSLIDPGYMMTGPIQSAGMEQELSAVLNGVKYYFDSKIDIASGFLGQALGVTGYPTSVYIGRLSVVIPLRAGTYHGQDSALVYNNASSGALEFDTYYSHACSTVDVANTPTPGGFVEGSFSGIVDGVDQFFGYIVITEGHFKLRWFPPAADSGVEAPGGVDAAVQ